MYRLDLPDLELTQLRLGVKLVGSYPEFVSPGFLLDWSAKFAFSHGRLCR